MRTISEIVDHNDAVLSVGQTTVLLTAEEWQTLKSVVLTQQTNNSPKVDITIGEYETVCCGISIGSAYDFCPKCGTNLW